MKPARSSPDGPLKVTPEQGSQAKGQELVIVSQNVETLVPLLQEIAQPKLHFAHKRPAKRQRRHSSSPSSSSSEDDPAPARSTLGVLRSRNPATYLIAELHPHIICLQEVKALASDTDLKRAISLVTDPANMASSGKNRYTAYSSLSRAKRGRNFGVTTFIRDDISVLRAREVEWDKEGRVMIIELEDVIVFNVYALNGSDSPWINPGTGRPQGTRNDRKRRFNELLMREVQVYNAKVPFRPSLIIGDFNISLSTLDCHPRLRTEHPHDIVRAAFRNEVIPGMDVVDLYRKLHGDVKAYSWFAVGKPHRTDCARVDYALLSTKALDSAVEMRYCEKDQGKSDHCPLMVKLDRDRLRSITGQEQLVARPNESQP